MGSLELDSAAVWSDLLASCSSRLVVAAALRRRLTASGMDSKRRPARTGVQLDCRQNGLKRNRAYSDLPWTGKERIYTNSNGQCIYKRYYSTAGLTVRSLTGLNSVGTLVPQISDAGTAPPC